MSAWFWLKRPSQSELAVHTLVLTRHDAGPLRTQALKDFFASVLGDCAADRPIVLEQEQLQRDIARVLE